MARPFLYHVFHRDAFDALPDFSSITITVPRLSGTGTETKTVYSLKKDMAALRTLGVSKGIVDGSVVDVGKSTEGRELWALKVGKGSSHKVLFTGCHHAREWISVAVAYYVAEHLIQTFKDPPTNDKEKRIKHLLLNREIWFVPMVNPDGHEFTMTQDRLWRPNRKAYNLPATTFTAQKLGGGSRTISHPAGVFIGPDPNRNYPEANWGLETNGALAQTSRDPRDAGQSSVWSGPSPGSEQEVQRIAALYRAQQFRAGLSYHSFSQLLLFDRTMDKDAFTQAVGRGMNDLIAEHGNPYEFLSAGAVTGDLVSFSVQVSPGRPSYVPELRPPRNGNPAFAFSGLPENQIEPCFRENVAAALALANCAGHNAASAATTTSTQFTSPSTTCQVVLDCAKVFKGYQP